MTYRPTLSAVASGDSTLFHRSTRTLVSTNAEPGRAGVARVGIHITRLEMRWVDGALVVAYSASKLESLELASRRGRAALMRRPGR